MPRSPAQKNHAATRARLLEELGTATGTDGWVHSPSPVKKRIARLEVAWREAIQWLLEDIRTMFANFETISDAYDVLDVNLAAVKSLCVDKGVFTEEEYQARRKSIFAIVDKERERRQQELTRILEEAKQEKEQEAQVDPELRNMREKAASTTDADHIPASATVFGG